MVREAHGRFGKFDKGDCDDDSDDNDDDDDKEIDWKEGDWALGRISSDNL